MRSKNIFRPLFLCTLVLCVQVLFSGRMQGQDIYGLRRMELEFHVGPAFPLGSFANPAFSTYEDKDAANPAMEYNGAKTGVNYALSIGYYLHPNWGLFVLFNGHSNKVGSGGFSIYQPGYEWAVKEKDNWVEFMAMAAPSFRCMIVEKLVFSARAYLGYAHLRSPFYSSYTRYGNFDYTFKISSSKAHSFGYGAGVAFKFLATRGFHIDLRCDYFGTVPFRYNDVPVTVVSKALSGGNENTPMKQPYDFKENFQMINVSLGFTVALGS